MEAAVGSARAGVESRQALDLRMFLKLRGGRAEPQAGLALAVEQQVGLAVPGFQADVAHASILVVDVRSGRSNDARAHVGAGRRRWTVTAIRMTTATMVIGNSSAADGHRISPATPPSTGRSVGHQRCATPAKTAPAP